MSDWTKITKEQFDVAYNKFSPNNWIKFAYKHFSTSTEQKNMSLKNDVAYILGSLFALGLLGTILNMPPVLIKVAVIPYLIILVTLVLYLFSAVILNNLRIRKIRKELGITSNEYDSLLAKFY
jgi:hypothetical protein